MHDFLLAKEMIEELKRIAQEKKVSKVKKVMLEIGQIACAHDGHPEHVEDVSLANLKFGLSSISKGTPFEDADFDIKKVAGDKWRLTGIEI